MNLAATSHRGFGPNLTLQMRLSFRTACALVALAGPMLFATPGHAGAQAAPRPGVLGAPRPSAPPPRQPPGTAPAPTAVPARPAVDSGPPLTLFGTVYDSLSQRPLVDATVQFVSERDRATSFNGTTDSSGNYRIRGVRPGRYIAGFYHPMLDALGATPPPQLVQVLPDTAARLDMGVPGPRRMRQVFCGATYSGDTTGALVGVVRDADSHLPVTNARVVVTWSEFRVSETGVGTVHRRVPAKVRPEGSFVICGLPADGNVVANAEAPGRPGGLIEVQVPTRSVLVRDFYLGDSATTVATMVPDTTAQKENRPAQPLTVTRGSSRLSGTVRTRDGRPLDIARVEVWGTGIRGQATESGSFALGGLPAGTQSLEVRAIGYEPKRVAVDLSARRPASVDVVLDKQVTQLNSVVVREKGSREERDYSGFLSRKKSGFGRYMTADDIDQRQPLVMTDLMRTMPGMTVSPNGQFGYVMRGRGGCTPDVIIDGMRVMEGADEIDNLIRPGDVDGVEVYTSSTGVPPEYAGVGGSSCGAVLVWTKRGGGVRKPK